MRLRNKIVLNVSGLVVLSLTVLTICTWWISSVQIESVLQEQVSERLISQRDTKKVQIEDYFGTIKNQIETQAVSVKNRDAAKAFIAAFKGYKRNPNLSPSQIDNSLRDFYQDQFQQKFDDLNPDNQVRAQDYIPSISETGRALQFAYISDNPHPMGEKSQLTDVGDNSRYSSVHRKYHDSYFKFLDAFGYYDVFIADIDTGDIVYSVYKELDFATSLLTGPYADSGIADAFKGAQRLAEGESVLIDFKPYFPSFDSPASFIASPVFVDGRAIAVLIFQMPVDGINHIMTYDGKWKTSGMGDSGESYLVGSDNKMRSNSRFLIEDKKAYLSAIKRAGASQSELDNISNKDTSIGFQSVSSATARKALSGGRGVEQIVDYRDVDVISAYTPLDIQGVNWALLSEFDVEEAYRPLTALKTSLTITSLIVSALLALVSVVVAVWLSNKISEPINDLIEFINCVASKLDFTNRYPKEKMVRSEDEIASLAGTFNKMMDTIENTVKDVKESSMVLVDTASSLSENFTNLSGKTEEQAGLTIQIATAIEELTMTSEMLEDLAKKTNQASIEGSEKSSSGQVLVKTNLETSQALANDMNQTCETMQQLSTQAENVGRVLEVIKSIAEQTNLLALNAAIEAARAGEQGRGFAVVADEVRTLAKRTQDSTEEISDIITELQAGSVASADSIYEANSRAESTQQIAEDVGASLQVIIELMRQIESYNSEVTNAASEQNAVAKDMSNRLNNITMLAEENQKSIIEAKEGANNVSAQTHKLEEIISYYKVSA